MALFHSVPAPQIVLRRPALLSPPHIPPLSLSLQMSTQLANGWVAAVDPGSGRTYYANSLTGATSWEVPAECVWCLRS